MATILLIPYGIVVLALREWAVQTGREYLATRISIAYILRQAIESKIIILIIKLLVVNDQSTSPSALFHGWSGLNNNSVIPRVNLFMFLKLAAARCAAEKEHMF